MEKNREGAEQGRVTNSKEKRERGEGWWVGPLVVTSKAL